MGLSNAARQPRNVLLAAWPCLRQRKARRRAGPTCRQRVSQRRSGRIPLRNHGHGGGDRGRPTRALRRERPRQAPPVAVKIQAGAAHCSRRSRRAQREPWLARPGTRSTAASCWPRRLPPTGMAQAVPTGSTCQKQRRSPRQGRLLSQCMQRRGLGGRPGMRTDAERHKGGHKGVLHPVAGVGGGRQVGLQLLLAAGARSTEGSKRPAAVSSQTPVWRLAARRPGTAAVLALRSANFANLWPICRLTSRSGSRPSQGGASAARPPPLAWAPAAKWGRGLRGASGCFVRVGLGGDGEEGRRVAPAVKP